MTACPQCHGDGFACDSCGIPVPFVAQNLTGRRGHWRLPSTTGSFGAPASRTRLLRRSEADTDPGRDSNPEDDPWFEMLAHKPEVELLYYPTPKEVFDYNLPDNWELPPDPEKRPFA